MTDRISEIRARCELATPGPWMIKIHNEQYGQGYGEITYFVDIEGELLKIGLADNNRLFAKYRSDADFIAHARGDIPYLLDRLAQAEAEVERLREAQRWVPVTERLPEVGGYYLTADDLGIVREARFYAEHVNPSWMHFSATLESITHWMPLPEPPATKTIQEWAELDEIQVHDPDGFDRTDPLLWERKFTKAEYDAGIMRCTVVPLPAPPEEGDTE